ncbi:uncharacterized protein LOC115892738, partial [Rhinopithecus roxellana]|uniref:uncharacterized protein LOC115892738 n=1 Tax=Rhinopithecus roxellana TaxID=61622 RepID=UPI0012379365
CPERGQTGASLFTCPQQQAEPPSRAPGASDCPHLLEERQLKILEHHADELQHPSQSQLILPGLPLCSNRRWEYKKFDAFALGWEYLTHAQFRKGLQLSRRPRSRQNDLLLPAKEHRQHAPPTWTSRAGPSQPKNTVNTHLQPGHPVLGLERRGPQSLDSEGSREASVATQQEICQRVSDVGWGWHHPREVLGGTPSSGGGGVFSSSLVSWSSLPLTACAGPISDQLTEAEELLRGSQGHSHQCV